MACLDGHSARWLQCNDRSRALPIRRHRSGRNAENTQEFPIFATFRQFFAEIAIRCETGAATWIALKQGAGSGPNRPEVVAPCPRLSPSLVLLVRPVVRFGRLASDRLRGANGKAPSVAMGDVALSRVRLSLVGPGMIQILERGRRGVFINCCNICIKYGIVRAL